ncbi:hypothetical protein DERF_007856 [Dermatophagoides farinae]|uniref:Uncharacterized protein n=1 Tax=Dermatophagoides farinae TaxID=6954 RepID=A0A922HYS4_DERFA|nr:hypothetical protein DERF_007856 [Dermatophagoides farinae]
MIESIGIDDINHQFTRFKFCVAGGGFYNLPQCDHDGYFVTFPQKLFHYPETLFLFITDT